MNSNISVSTDVMGFSVVWEYSLTMCLVNKPIHIIVLSRQYCTCVCTYVLYFYTRIACYL